MLGGEGVPRIEVRNAHVHGAWAFPTVGMLRCETMRGALHLPTRSTTTQ